MKKYFLPSIFFLFSILASAQIDTTLMRALMDNNLIAVKVSINNGANVNARDTNNATVLMWATYKSDLEIVKFLIDKGADYTQKGNIHLKSGGYYGNLIGIAAAEGKLPHLTFLIDKCGIDVNDLELNLEGGTAGSWTAFQWAVSKEHQDCIEYLLEKGADKNAASGQLAEYYRKKGEYKKALPMALKALEITEKKDGKKDLRYGHKLGSLGLIYRGLGQYKKALTVFQQVLEIYKIRVGKNHNYYGIALNNLALAYRDLGNYQRALTIAQQAFEVTKKTRGKEHREYATRLGNLGLIYKLLGQYHKALALANESLKVVEKTLGIEHPVFGTALDNVAMLHWRMGKYQNALFYSKKALEVTKNSLGGDHPFYGIRLSNTALIYLSLGEYQNALSYTQKALVIAEQKGKESGEYANSLNVLSKIYKNQKQYEKALYYAQETLDVTEKSFGVKHNWYGSRLVHLSNIYEILGDYQASATYHKQTFDNSIYLISNQFDQFSEAEQRSLLRLIRKRFRTLQSLAIRHPEINSVTKLGYNSQLMIKGLTLGNRKQLLEGLRHNEDEALKKSYIAWQENSQILGRQYSLSKDKRIDTFDSLVIVVNDMESNLARQSTAFRQARKQVGWKQVMEQLNESEAAIEFAQFRYHDVGHWTDSTMYVAYILRKGYHHPKMVYLFEERELNQVLSIQKQRKLDYVDQLYSFDQRGAKRIAGDKQSLYELTWEPLDSLLEGIDRIYYSPSGLLHRITLSAIPINEEQTLSDLYELYNMGSTRQLEFKDEDQKDYQYNDAIIYGGILYEMDSTAIVEANLQWIETDSTANNETAFENSIATRGDDWVYLKWTEQEANEIKDLLEGSGIKVSLQKGYQATEESFRQIGEGKPSPRILHLATHGFFFPDPKEEHNNEELMGMDGQSGFRASENPMIRSGLVLAGANRTWSGGQPLAGFEDGILTAYEISQMDLSNTELVVLSACETGLGDIQGNEGVYGLQRAFKIAGAKYIIMSLWQVPDYQTKELMTTFYQEWLGGKEIPDAFRNAQQQMRKKYQNPYFWAGFVLVE